MKSLLKSVGQVFVPSFLGLNPIWITLLKEQGYIGPQLRMTLICVFSIVFVFHQIYLALPKPATRGGVEQLRQPIETLLAGLLDQYDQRVSGLRGAEMPPHARTNIMLVTRSPFWLYGAYLEISYNKTHSGLAYGDPELSLTWKKGEGACGAAWAKEKTVCYDSKDVKLGIPSGCVTMSQKEATAHLNSVVSMPIWKDGRIVGVLSLDSQHNIEESCLLDKDILSLAQACSRCVGLMCSADGVVARE